MSLSRRYGIINIAYHGSFHDGKELYTMSNVKRKDSKNRNLRNGESQRKDGGKKKHRLKKTLTTVSIQQAVK